MQQYRDNLYEAFSSKLFVDDCDLDNKLQAFTEVEKMFKHELEILHDMVKSTVQEEKSKQLLFKIINIKNLSKTMSDLNKNIISEIDNSREQMFHILESIAALEISKDPK